MRIGTIEFASRAEYNAGLRDYNRIQRLKLQYDLQDQTVAAKLYKELKQQTFFFETEVGKNFIRGLAEELGPSGRGLGVGIARRVYQEPEELNQKIQDKAEKKSRSIREQKLTKTKYPAAAETKAVPVSRISVISYLNTAQTEGNKDNYKEHIEGKERSQNLTEQKSSAAVKNHEDSQNAERLQNSTAAQDTAKQPKKKSIFFEKPLKIAALLSSLVILFCIVDEAFYRYQIYQSGVKIQQLQESILTPITTVSEESAVILDKIALASSENAVIQTMDLNSTQDAAEEAEPEVLYEYSALYERNPDLIGWIEIPGTIVNYPVMQTKEDQNFYLRRDFDKQDDVSGLPFLDARSDILDRTTNLLIYGHNMKNGSMFATLLEYKDQDFYNEHKTIVFNTIYEKAEYEIVAAFQSAIADVDEDVFRYYNFIDAATKEEFDSFISSISALTEYDTGVHAEYGDELITLSTCDKSVDEDGRYVVVARKITDQ